MKKILIGLVLTISVLTNKAQEIKAFTVSVSGKGQPVLLIPGYSCGAEVWKETVDHLKNRFECHVINIAGYAGVAPIDTPVLKTVRDELIRYVQSRKLQKPALVGHSLGAFMSLWVSSSQPDLFGKLVCVDGLPFVSAMNDSSVNAEALKKDPRFDPATVVKSFESIPDEGYIEATAQSMRYQVNDTARARQIATWSFKGDRKTLAHTIIEISTTDLRREISKIRQPVLVLGSLYGTEANSYKVLEQQYREVKNKTIRVAASKHFIMYDQPQWFFRELDGFLTINK